MTAATRQAERRLLDDGGRGPRPMVWVMAVMLYLTVLAGALGLATMAVTRGLDRQLGARMTVQLTSGDEAATARVLGVLDTAPGVAGAAVVPPAEMAQLLKPWLGDASIDADLPIPTMIDVDLADQSDAAAGAIGALVRKVAPDARVDRAASWLAPARSFVAGLALLAAGLVLLTALATAGMVVLTARAGLETHSNTIDVLHMLGSTDGQIARLFQRRIALDTLLGGAAGGAAGLVTAWLIGRQVRALDPALTAGASLGAVDWGVLALLPLVFAALATVAARIAITRAMRRVL